MNTMIKYIGLFFIYICITTPSYAQNSIAFVSNRESGDISIIGTSKSEVIDTINVGSKPRGMVINPVCTRLYVTLQDSDELVVINTETKEIIARIQVGNEPFAVEVHPSGNPVYVSNWQDEYITVIDANYNKVSTNLEAGKDQQIVKFNPSGEEACVSHRGSRDSISVIGMNQTNNFKEIPIGNGDSDPRDLVFHPSGKSILVASRGNDQVYVMDAVTKSSKKAIEVGDEPVNIVLTRDGSKAYVTNNGDDTVSVIDLASDYKIVATIPVGNRPNGLEITPDSKFVFVANKNDTVSVIETSSNRVIKTINVGKEPWDIAICQSSPLVSMNDEKRIMQIYGSVYSKSGGKNKTLAESKNLILDCDGKIQHFKTFPDGQYKISNNTGIKECKIKVKINEVSTSWPPVDVIFSSKPRRYDIVY